MLRATTVIFGGRGALAVARSRSTWLFVPLGLFLAALCVLTLQGSASAAFPGASGRIAFDSNYGSPDRAPDVYTMKPDGSGLKRLTTGGASSPMFSSDGTKIVFTKYIRYVDGDVVRRNGDIYVMDSDGTGKRNLTNSPAVDEARPVLSPDGTKIAFVRWTYDNEGERSHLYVMNVDGSEQRSLTGQPTADDSDAMFSPDGTKVVFSSTREWVTDIYTVNTDGSDEKQLTSTDTVDDSSPAFSPDGAKIVFVSSPTYGETSADLHPQISIMNADGTDQRRLTAERRNDGFAISPDGTKIAFTRYLGHRDGYDIFTMNLDGSDETRLTDKGRHGLFSFSPDSRKIVFGRYLGGGSGIWTMNANGSGKRNLTGSETVYPGSLDWGVRP